MTQEEFKELKVNDIITNKHMFTNRLNETKEIGYDYLVTQVFPDWIQVKSIDGGYKYAIELKKLNDYKYLTIKTN